MLVYHGPGMSSNASPPRHLIAQISIGAIERNLRFLRDAVAPGCEVWPVVKADAYGLGLRKLWPVLAAGSDGLCVSNSREALELRSWGYEGGLLVLFPVGAMAPGEATARVLPRLIEERLELTVVSPAEVDAVAQAARRVGVEALVQLKIDTGMRRGGALPAAAGEVWRRIRDSKHLRLTGVFTHFAAAEDPDLAFTGRQLEIFGDWIESFGTNVGVDLHAANSAAVLELEASHLNRVRPGLSVFGYSPAGHLEAARSLQPALTLKSHLMQTKDVSRGDACGYGLTFRFERPGRIGLVPIGYADGYLRALSNCASMRIRGQDVPVRGTVAMDQTIVDLTDLPAAQVGDEVEIIAADASAANSVEALARLAETIPYEILTRLGARIERRLVD